MGHTGDRQEALRDTTLLPEPKRIKNLTIDTFLLLSMVIFNFWSLKKDENLCYNKLFNFGIVNSLLPSGDSNPKGSEPDADSK